MKRGDIIGELKLIRQVEGRNRPHWLVRCACEREWIVREWALRNGQRGCLTCTRRRQAVERCAHS